MIQEIALDAVPTRGEKLRGVARVAGRYGLSTFGPVSIAGAHFIASLFFLRVLPPAEFGMVSFVFVAVPPLLSVSMSLVAASLYTASYLESAARTDHSLLLKANLSLSLALGLMMAALMLACGASWAASALFGVYGGLMGVRQFARCFAYVEGRLFAVAGSDAAYSILLLLGITALFIFHVVSVFEVSALLALGALLALIPFGASYLRRQFTAGLTGWMQSYAATFRDLTRWSLLGVVSTEMTANAHAYVVTLVAGPQSFALLAVGALFMRPVSLFLTALPDLERASMARGIAGGNAAAALHSVRNFRLATAAAWAVTIGLAAAILIWFPGLVLKRHYAVNDVATVVALWAAIMAVRIVRTPESVLLQAAAEFKPLAWASVSSACVSMVLTLALLLIWGPIASLTGILVGDIVMTVRIRRLLRQWRQRHGC